MVRLVRMNSKLAIKLIKMRIQHQVKGLMRIQI